MIKNNNPGNIRWRKQDVWQGMIGKDDDNFVIFSDLLHGIRALAKNLLSAYRLHDRRTIAEIVPPYAPGADHNDVPAYIAHVCKQMQKHADELLDIDDPATLVSLVAAMSCHETGVVIPHDTIVQGVALALA